MTSSLSHARTIFLLADSQLFFWGEGEDNLLERIRRALPIEASRARAAYLGASNGDAPEFFELFRSVMGDIGVRECVHVRADANEAALAFVETADLLLLAGGDVEAGWRAFEEKGLADRVRKRWMGGAVLIGVSAGAVQIGMEAALESGKHARMLALVPYVIGVHDEPQWRSLAALVKRGDGEVVGLGIPTGGGVIVHSDLSVEPVRRPLVEVTYKSKTLRIQELLSAPLPPDPSAN